MATLLTDPPDVVETPRREARQARYLVIPLLVAMVVWIPLFVQRVHAHQPNTDDYGYAVVARHIAQSGDFVRTILDTGKNAPLVPALASPLELLFGFYGAMAVELPILLVLVAGAYVLARSWISPRAAMVTSLLVGLNAAVLGYSTMLNFALASSAAMVWTLAAYLRCHRLQDLRWSIVLGVSFTALLLARSMAPVYAIPFAALVAVDVGLGLWRRQVVLGRPAVWAAGIIVVFAGSWWFVSGPVALHYLLNVGYQPSAGFAKQGASLSPSNVVDRVGWELANMGWVQSIGLGAAVVAAAWVAGRSWGRLKTGGLWMLAAWLVVTLLVLSSTTNKGTAFGLPLIAVVIVLCAAVLGQLQGRALSAVAGAALAVLVIGIPSQFTTVTNSWWHGPPYRVQVLESGGTTRTNIDELTGQVARAIGTVPTLLAQNDRLLNWNGLRWASGDKAHLLVPSQGPNDTRMGLRKLTLSSLMITGRSPQTFEPSMDQSMVIDVAEYSGFHVIRRWTITPQVNAVLWERIPPLTKSEIKHSRRLQRHHRRLGSTGS